MTPDQARAFVQALGGKNLGQKSAWVTAGCPLARWTHKNGKDSNPSFGITTATGKPSHWNCFACGSGSAEDLLQAVEYHLHKNNLIALDYGVNIGVARHLLDSEYVGLQALPDYMEFQENAQHEFQEWPLYWLDSFIPASMNDEARTYLLGRDVSSDEQSAYNLRWDSQRRMVVFPYFNVYNKFAGARGRAIDQGVTGHKKHFDYTWNSVNNSRLCWYNEQCLELDGPVVVVEGQFDALRVLKAYPKVVANLTAKPTWAKLCRLQQSETVIHIPDNDGPGGAGESSQASYRNFCQEHGLKYLLVDLPLPPGGDKIDPGECSAEYLRDRLQELKII